MKRSRSVAGSRRAARFQPKGVDVVNQLTGSARRGELVAVIGTGVSMALTNGAIPALSWRGLIRDGLAHGLRKGKLTAAQSKSREAQLDSSDLDDLLGAAEFVGRKLDAPRGDLYARWLADVFKSVQPANKKMETALRSLYAAGVPFCTLNYDTLLERVTTRPAINLSDTANVAAWMRRESQGILHLHGSWDAPATCILGIRDYETTVGNDVRDLVQRSLASFRRLLFIGCGDTFGDPNLSALITWLRERMKTAAPEHYALVSDGEVAARDADRAWHGFVEPLSYGADRTDLPDFLLRHFVAPTVAAATRRGGPAKGPVSSAGHTRLLEGYRAFLLKDCGQMTIEGVRADMDTAQRRFDLERLFVPLRVLPSPPDIPESDPKREQKLLRWHEKNKTSRPFGSVFTSRKRLALLALPGGGKTLLLKRLAVAYADPPRRSASDDALPDVPLMPVLIRCREWREHIHRPIPTLLRSIPDITGRAALAGLSDALAPLFKDGRILLLVDGLDEIHDDALRSTFVEHLEAFLGEHKLTRLVVTSREAGFSLVAPSLARFCERWRVAPLEAGAITALSNHWHRLMVGDSPEIQAEGQELADHLVGSNSLRRLAENPLLLTMLLVVKHGAGRLPPDRVSLYTRAVEVLLDTWNIKGHDPLNPKEAVPQLACVAFQLMRAGKQTATEKELLTLLEEARESVPQIGRYAKDTPHEFLKRVELRSSLLVEGGRQVDGSRTVPFYQFRHLTFQEHLAAVATVEGHYVEYQKSDTVLTPLAPYLTTDEWKEVIPMAAVLARKQAEPLMAALVAEGSRLRQTAEAKEDFAGSEEWTGPPHKLPAAVGRLVQCLAEEAEAAPETLIAALQLIAFFARGCRSADDWGALGRGPYGEELWYQAWILYSTMQLPRETWILNTCASLAVRRQPETYWGTNDGKLELQRLLGSQKREEVARGLLIRVGLLWLGQTIWWLTPGERPARDDLERHLFHDDPALWRPAVWTWAFFARDEKRGVHPSPAVLNRLMALWFSDASQAAANIAAYGLSTQIGAPREIWKPVLTEEIVQRLREIPPTASTRDEAYVLAASVMVAFHAGDVLPDDELARRMIGLNRFAIEPSKVSAMVRQMGGRGRTHHPSKGRSRRKRSEKATKP